MHGLLFDAGVLVGSTLAITLLLTGSSIRYARRARMLDLPGQRRSHSVPTPRGGGIGIVGAVFGAAGLAAWCLPQLALPWRFGAALLAATALVAAVGWIDDHRGLPARWRFLAHGVAAAILFAAMEPALVPFWPPFAGAAVMFEQGLIAAGLWLAIVWSINLHNFMDGIDGILATQAIFVFSVLAMLVHHGGGSFIAVVWLCVFATASAGFLPFNFPRARIFMGDVGSGVLGLLVAATVLWQMATPGVALASGIVVCSAFVTDATCTLLSRVLRGRRWYSAHREHLYQWLVRCGHSHARVVALYMGWNLVIVLPVVFWMNRTTDVRTAMPGAIGAAIAVYALAAGVWWCGKRSCLRAISARRTHAAA